MKVILEMGGNDYAKFEDIMCSDDDNFNFYDNIIWLLDYGEDNEVAIHRTEFGEIKIRKEID